MQYIDFKVQHQTITRIDKYEVVGGSQNYLYARFTFCAEWADITATAVFSTNSGKHYSALIEDGECLVPWEVLTGAEFWVGVFGGKRVTTSTARVPVKPGVKLNASPGVQPTPSAYETLMTELREGMVHIDDQTELAGEAATQAVEKAAEAGNSAAAAITAAAGADSAKKAVLEALNNVPAGSTVIVNNLTTGGTSAALSAGMGKTLAGWGAVVNLMDNSDFSAIVNQKGAAVYSDTVVQYCVDRWVRAQRAMVEVQPDRLVFTNTGDVMNSFYQYLAPEKTVRAGETVTLACEDGDGNIYAGAVKVPETGYVKAIDIGDFAYGRVHSPTSYEHVMIQFPIRVGKSGSLKWVALYRGEYTKDTLPPYRPKGYATERLECQRYYQLFSSESTRPAAAVDYRPVMRANPATGSIDIDGVTYCYADANL